MGKKREFMTAVPPFMSKMLKHDILTAEQELELARRVQRGDQKAVDELIKHNLRSVLSNAQGFLGYGVGIEDLFQVGIIGLQTAILKFDPKLGFRLGTYASWWIRQAIHRYCQENANTIRLPTNVWVKMHRVKKKQRAAEADPDNKELAAALAADPDLDFIREVLSHEPVSLDHSKDSYFEAQGERLSLYDVVGDTTPTAIDPDQRLEDEHESSQVRQALAQLSPREQYVLNRRFADDHTLAEIANDHDLSRERVRQIEAKALKKLARILVKMRQGQ